MRVRTYNNLANEAALNNVMNRFFNTLAYDYSRSGGSVGTAGNGTAGNGTAGNGTAGNGTAGNGTVSNGTSNGEASQASEQETLLPLDVVATPDAFQVNTYLPGVNPEDVEITFEGEELTIRGKLPAAPEGTEFIKRELYHGAFVRRLSFNVPVDADRIEAHFHNGLLTLTVPKAEAVKPKQIKIQTK